VLIRTRATIFDASLPEHQGSSDNEYGPFILKQSPPGYAPSPTTHRPTFETVTDTTCIVSKATAMTPLTPPDSPTSPTKKRSRSFSLSSGSTSKLSVLSDSLFGVDKGKENWKLFPQGKLL
jgi:hypothetical protein